MASSLFPDVEVAPEWFENAIGAPHESNFWIAPDGSKIHFLRWRRSENHAVQSLKEQHKEPQGILFIHGTAAHAHWWHHIAPLLSEGSEGYDVIAISLSGHGDSDDRLTMSPSVWAEDVVSIMRTSGFLDFSTRAAPPVLVGHSMGGYVAVDVARRHPQCVGGIVLLDTAIPHPMFFLIEKLLHKQVQQRRNEDNTAEATDTADVRSSGANITNSATSNRPQPRRRAHPMSVTPFSRLRLSPPQQIRHPFIVEHVANMSVRAASTPPNSASPAWEWKADPDHRNKIPFLEYVYNIGTPEVLHNLRTRIAIYYGEDSIIVPGPVQQYMRHILGEHIAITGIPDAEHHCLFDQPLAVVTMLRATLAEWGRSATGAFGSGASALPLPRMRARAVESDWIDSDLTALCVSKYEWRSLLSVHLRQYNLLPSNYSPPSQAPLLKWPREPKTPLPIGAKL